MSFPSFVNLLRFLDMICGSWELYVSFYDDFDDYMFGYLEEICEYLIYIYKLFFLQGPFGQFTNKNLSNFW